MALEQHPVPQQISSYQFRLVGDMTLKQFFQLAAGAGIGLLIYGSPLPGFVKWPLIIFFVISGAAFAFLPIQDRPLSVWLMAFFRSVYSPTIYVWKREEQPVYYAPEDSEIPSIAETGETVNSQGDIQAQFGEVASGFLENLEGAEEKYLSKITGLFKHEPASNAAPQQPAETVKVVNEVAPAVPPIPTFSPTPPAPAPVPTMQPAPTLPGNQPPYYRPVPTPPPTPDPFDHPLFQQNPVLDQTPNFVPSTEKPIFQADTPPSEQPVTPVFQEVVQQSPVANESTIYGLETPTQANILVGKVFDYSQSPIANAIMEIKDEFGRPVRALKTDKDGRFRIVTPLHDGKYTIFTEKDGYEFDPIHLELQETIIEPMIIEPKAKQQ